MYFEVYPTPPANALGQLFAAPQWRWRLRAANHEIIAQGESYVNKRDCERAVTLLKRTGVFTPVRQARA